MICDAMVLGLAWTTVVAVGGLPETDFASLGCPSSDSSGVRARLLVSPSGEGLVATGYNMTAERRPLSGSFAESALGETALTGTAPVERPVGTAPPQSAATHAFTRSKEAGAESIGSTTTLFVGLESEDILGVTEGAGAELVGLSGLSPCGNGRARAGKRRHTGTDRWRSSRTFLCECMRAYVLGSGHTFNLVLLYTCMRWSCKRKHVRCVPPLPFAYSRTEGSGK